MYLSIFNEKQKILFLEFANKLAASDGNLSMSEKTLLDSYRHEMQIPVDFYVANRSNERIINDVISECGTREKKIMIFEAVGLALIDGKYSELEKNLISMYAEKLEIDSDFICECESILLKYIELQNSLNSLVIGEF